jgi:hypothetical protein
VDAASDSVKSRLADAAVERFGVEFDVVEVVLERLLADKFVNRCQRLFRFVVSVSWSGTGRVGGGMLGTTSGKQVRRCRPDQEPGR